MIADDSELESERKEQNGEYIVSDAFLLTLSFLLCSSFVPHLEQNSSLPAVWQLQFGQIIVGIVTGPFMLILKSSIFFR